LPRQAAANFRWSALGDWNRPYRRADVNHAEEPFDANLDVGKTPAMNAHISGRAQRKRRERLAVRV
jgi:hypothetical protein